MLLLSTLGTWWFPGGNGHVQSCLLAGVLFLSGISLALAKAVGFGLVSMGDLFTSHILICLCFSCVSGWPGLKHLETLGLLQVSSPHWRKKYW